MIEWLLITRLERRALITKVNGLKFSSSGLFQIGTKVKLSLNLKCTVEMHYLMFSLLEDPILENVY